MGFGQWQRSVSVYTNNENALEGKNRNGLNGDREDPPVWIAYHPITRFGTVEKRGRGDRPSPLRSQMDEPLRF